MCLSISVYLSVTFHHWRYLVYIMMVNDAVKAPIDVIEHVHNLHWCAVLAQSGEANYVTEIYRHLLVQLWLHRTSLLQAFHHWAAQTQTDETGSLHSWCPCVISALYNYSMFPHNITLWQLMKQCQGSSRLMLLLGTATVFNHVNISGFEESSHCVGHVYDFGICVLRSVSKNRGVVL